MADADDPANPMLGNQDRKAIAGPFLTEHHGHPTPHVDFGLNAENPYLFLFIQVLDHPFAFWGIPMLVSTPLCLLLAWWLTRPILQLQKWSPTGGWQSGGRYSQPGTGRRDRPAGG